MHLSKYTGDKAALGVSLCGLRTNDLTTDVGKVDCRKCKVAALSSEGERERRTALLDEAIDLLTQARDL